MCHLSVLLYGAREPTLNDDVCNPTVGARYFSAGEAGERWSPVCVCVCVCWVVVVLAAKAQERGRHANVSSRHRRAITLSEATINLHYSSVSPAGGNEIRRRPRRDALSDVAVSKKLGELIFITSRVSVAKARIEHGESGKKK